MQISKSASIFVFLYIRGSYIRDFNWVNYLWGAYSGGGGWDAYIRRGVLMGLYGIPYPQCPQLERIINYRSDCRP